MLRATYRLLTASPPVPEGYKRDALIEVFCIHARSLLDFFMNKRMKDDDVLASEFTNGFDTQLDAKKNPLKKILERINKQVFHLTKKRTTVADDQFRVIRDGTEVVNQLEAEIDRFTHCLHPGLVLKCKTQPIPLTQVTLNLLANDIATTYGQSLQIVGPTS